MPSRGVPWLSDIMPDKAWAGERCFVVGGGPSLRDFDWELLRGAGKIIAINRAVEKVPWADIMFSMDSRLYQWYHERSREMRPEAVTAFRNFKGLKVWLDSHCYRFHPDIHMVRWIGKHGVSKSLKRGIYSGGNGGYAGMMLAVALGCKEIVLLGFDMGHDGGNSHWHDGYPVRSCNPLTRTWIQGFEKSAPLLADMGVRVINANPHSNIRCFPFGSVMRQREGMDNFIICSFYTLDYMEAAIRLRKQISDFGIEYDFQKINRCSTNYSDWQRETFYKANFIKQMLDKHPSKDIVWLDADAELLQFPEIFGGFPGTLGARIFMGRKLLTGTVYFKNCREIHAVVDDWIQENQQPRKQFRCQQEQLNLQAVVDRTPGKVQFVNLPREYCYIFDEREPCEDPVIIHRQHSRKFRGTKCTA